MRKQSSGNYILGSVAVLVGACIFSAAVGSAHAGAFAIREQSAIGQGTSFAGMAATSGDLSNIFWNPATITGVEGTQTQSVYSVIIPNSELSNIQTTGAAASGDPGQVGLSAFIPGSYASMQVTDDLFLGLSVNAPFGLATKAHHNSATSFHSRTAGIKTIDVKATIGYRVNEMLSLGIGLGAQYLKVRMNSFPLASAGAHAKHELKGDSIEPNFTAGVNFTPWEGTDIGIGFRSAAFHVVDGTEALPNNTVTNVTAKLYMPETVSLGIRHRVNDAFTLMAGAEWTNWSRIGTSAINGSLANTALALEYQDGWYTSAGMEYAYNDKLTLRTGIGYEFSPVQDAHRNLRLPDENRFWASAGFSYQWNEELGFDFGYTHIFVEDAVVHAEKTSAPPSSYRADAESRVDIISASMRYQWKTEPMFAGDDPIVRKY
ncbi:OmpP1/FadL family transporter [Cohaesibacter gelatinilyticus]|uniref:Long-chain fatty acid transport protein n=1 Tax=Cohaesibacter gelatinilyticus TaxID=372072 RepID=A0A285NIZ3_9HYPH|nr:outer membrane protein transport protein [Cohaesibacter gelatinilyticus]SNZ08937.1 long-chain fatty acid transport protein [Cohaesibacter gelatinilyticus]